jgi:hypothetical protein
MFIENNGLVFIKSKNIQAFPCGRRRSNLIDADKSSDTRNDRYYIPFDPEARLNTEANNRKHSGLNGFKQSYLKSWISDGIITFVIEGYLFTITAEEYATDVVFGNAIEKLLGTANTIYANIQLANIKFFDGMAGVGESATEVLRDQSLNEEPSNCLDLLIDNADKSSPDSYYFSGLSFSTKDKSNSKSGLYSVQILAKDDTGWHIYNPFRLPNIEHGNLRHSIKVPGDVYIYSDDDQNFYGNLTVDENISAKVLNADSVQQNGHSVALLNVVKSTDESGAIKYQLKFSGAVEKELSGAVEN